MPVFERRIGNSLSYISDEVVIPTDADEAINAKTFHSMVGCLSQLSELVKKSGEVFSELSTLTSTINQRLDGLAIRTAALYNDNESIVMPSNTTLISSSDNHQSQNYRPFLQVAATQHLVKSTIPMCILTAYESNIMQRPPEFHSLDAYKSSLMNAARIATITHRYSNPDFFLNQWCAAQETRLRKLEVEKERQKNDKKMRKLQSETTPVERRNSKKKESISWQDRYMVNGQPVHRTSRTSLGEKSGDSPTSRDAVAENKKPFAHHDEGHSSPPVSPVPVAITTENQSSMVDSSPSPPHPPAVETTAAAAAAVSGHKRRVSFETPNELPPAVTLKLQQKQDAQRDSPSLAPVDPSAPVDDLDARDSIRSEAVSSASTPVLHGAGSRGPVFSIHSDTISSRTDSRASDSDDDSDFDETVDYRLDPKYRVQPPRVDLNDSSRVFVSLTPLVVGRGYSTKSYGTVKSNATLHYSSAYPHGDDVSSRTAPGAQGDSPVTDSPVPEAKQGSQSVTQPPSPPPPPSPKPATAVASGKEFNSPTVTVSTDTALSAPVVVSTPSPPPVRLSVSPPPPPPPVGISPKAAAGGASPPPPPGPSPTKRDSESFAVRKASVESLTSGEEPVKAAPSSFSIAGSLFGFASSTAGGDSSKNPSPPPPPPRVSPMAGASTVKPLHYLEDDSNNGMITLSMPPINPPRPPPPVIAAPNKRSSQRLLVKSIRFSTRTQPAQFHIESEMVDVDSPPKKAPHPLTAGILSGAKLTSVAETNHSPGHDAANRDGSDNIARRESAPPAIGNIFAAIRRGSTLKKVDPKEEEEKKKEHNRAKSMGGFGDSSVAAILERRKFLEAESSGSESDNDWD